MTEPKADDIADGVAVPITLNPLVFPEMDEKKRGEPDPTIEDVVRYLCEDVNATPANLARRYKELTEQSPTVRVVPALEEIVKKMLVPLHGAISNYMLGNYHGTIALCGLVCEMLAIFIYEMHDVGVRGEVADDATQRKLFGRTFEKLGQERRVDVLSGFGVMNT